MHKGNSSSSVRVGRLSSSSSPTTTSFSCWMIMLLVAFAMALVGVMVVDKLRERRLLNLVMSHKDRQTTSLRLLLQREKGYNKEMKKFEEEMRGKVYALRSQKMELNRRVQEMQSTVHSLKEERKVLESAMEEKQKEIKILRGMTTQLKKDDQELRQRVDVQINQDSNLTTGSGNQDSKPQIGKIWASKVNSTDVKDDGATRDVNNKIESYVTRVEEQKEPRVESAFRKNMIISEDLQADVFPGTRQDTREMADSGSRDSIREKSNVNSTKNMINGNGQLEEKGGSEYEENSGGGIKLELNKRSGSDAGSIESLKHGRLSRSSPGKEKFLMAEEKQQGEKIQEGNSTNVEEMERIEKKAEWERRSENENMPSKRFYDQQMPMNKTIDGFPGNGTKSTEDTADKAATDVEQKKTSTGSMEGALKHKATEDTDNEDEEEPEDESAFKEETEEEDKEEYKEETDESEF